jgi:hypothetical protein
MKLVKSIFFFRLEAHSKKRKIQKGSIFFFFEKNSKLLIESGRIVGIHEIACLFCRLEFNSNWSGKYKRWNARHLETGRCHGNRVPIQFFPDIT